MGGLSDNSGDQSFTYGTNSYTIEVVTVEIPSKDGGFAFGLTGALTDEDRSKLALHVGSNSFAFSSAGYESSFHTYRWPMTSLDWSSATSVTLRLRDDPPPPRPT